MVNKMSVKTMVVGALLTAIVFIMQFMGASIRMGTFSVSLVLIPIVIGAITCGKTIGAWLGLVFGVSVIASGDAAPFWAVNTVGTIITVLIKGILCGYAAGAVYQLMQKYFNKPYLSAIAASVVCPIVNTGVFLLGCAVFFMETVTEWAGGLPVGNYIIFGLVGANFIFETAVNIIFAPALVHIVKAVSKK